MGESPWYIGKMEGDFINNIICIYNFFGESLTRLYYLVKSWWITNTNGESLVQNGKSLRNGESLINPKVVAVAWHKEGTQKEIVKELDNIFGESLTRLYYLIKSWRIISTNGESLVQNGELLSSGVWGVGSNEDMVVELGVEGRKPPRPSMEHGDSWGKWFSWSLENTFF